MSIVLDEELRGFRMEDDEVDGGIDPDAVTDDDDELDGDELEEVDDEEDEEE